eukprot:TRINITY_DN2067_c0_g3_i1.p1 TRINITY_DN2067_c0_g3~~TRINITY_DN2067_c0_g3_i1.p1  ORF type:complete len:384 (-),score=111.11 TRINITY_DN2067_c0_g3_i1:736-1887(-)
MAPSKKTASAATAGKGKRDVPAFLTKTFDMVADSKTNKTVTWTREGKSFVVLDPQTFSSVVLPKYFKHNNFSSFVRQLNMYGFTKSGEVNWWEFQHPYFVCGRPEHLKHIKRKIAMTTQSGPGTHALVESFMNQKEKLHNQLSSLQTTQSQLNTQVSEVQDSNDHLWKQVQETREMVSQMKNSVTHLFSFVNKMYSGQKRPASLVWKNDDGSVADSTEDEKSSRRVFKRRRLVGADDDDDTAAGDDASSASCGKDLDAAERSIAQSKTPLMRYAETTEVEEVDDNDDNISVISVQDTTNAAPASATTPRDDTTFQPSFDLADMFPKYEPAQGETLPAATPRPVSVSVSAAAKVKDPSLTDMTLISEVWDTVPDISENQTCPSF